MIIINGQEYEVLYYVEKIDVFKSRMDKVITTFFAMIVAKVLLDVLRDE